MKHNWEYKTIRSMCNNIPYRGVISSYDGKYWFLNLDKIASGEGKVTEYEYFQDSDILKGSVTTFGKDYVLYSKLRPNLNKQKAIRMFSDFISANDLTSEQKEFINNILNYVCQNGDMDKSVLRDNRVFFQYLTTYFRTKVAQVANFVALLHNAITAA